MAGHGRQLLAGVAVLVALLVGCSSDDDTITLPTSESTTSSSRPAPTTEAPTTTEAPIETSATKPELVIPTEWESDLDEIFGRYLLYWEAEEIALGAPEANPDYPPLDELLGERAYSEVIDRAQSYKDDGLILVVPEESIGRHILRMPNPAVLAKDEDREVIIQDCWIQDDEKQSLDGVVVEQNQNSVLFNVIMRVESGEWRVASVTVASEQSSGYRECTDYLEYLDSSPPCPECWPYGQE